MKVKTISTLFVVIIVIVGFCLPAVAAEKPIRLGMVNFSLCCPYFIGMSKAVEAEAAAYPNFIRQFPQMKTLSGGTRLNNIKRRRITTNFCLRIA